MAGRAVAICWQVLTKILIVIISWRWDLECFNFFFELLLLFKHFTKKWFVTCSVRDGSQILVYLFILQYPNSLDFHVLPIKVCDLINFLHLPQRTSVVSCQVWGISVGASPWELRNSDSTPSHPKPAAPPPSEGCCSNLFCPGWPGPSHFPLPPFLQTRTLASDSTTELSSDMEIPAISSTPHLSPVLLIHSLVSDLALSFIFDFAASWQVQGTLPC